ncbi:hypothetical protein [Nitratireductor thuwali]|uniref:hypothetical protein n=1 Tax=Nitratireductor thuwali TaxID=2267699 RepID=UPI0030CECEEC
MEVTAISHDAALWEGNRVKEKVSWSSRSVRCFPFSRSENGKADRPSRPDGASQGRGCARPALEGRKK